MNIIEINNLNFKYDNNEIFQNFNLCIEENTWTTIMGANNSGKTTLIKILLGFLSFSGSIIINDINSNKKNIKKIRNILCAVFSDFDKQFTHETLEENIKFSLKNMNLSEIEIKSRITEISNYFDISDLLKKNISDLSVGQRQIVSIIYSLSLHPKILILDESLDMICKINKENLLNAIKKFKTEYQTTVINITQNIEESLYGDNILLIENGNIILYDINENVYKKEKVLKSLGYDLPFMVNLSNKLKYYGLINKTYYKKEDLIGDLWK